MMRTMSYTQFRYKLSSFAKDVNAKYNTNFTIQHNPDRHYVDIMYNGRVYIRVMEANKVTLKEYDGFRDHILMKINKRLDL